MTLLEFLGDFLFDVLKVIGFTFVAGSSLIVLYSMISTIKKMRGKK